MIQGRISKASQLFMFWSKRCATLSLAVSPLCGWKCFLVKKHHKSRKVGLSYNQKGKKNRYFVLKRHSCHIAFLSFSGAIDCQVREGYWRRKTFSPACMYPSQHYVCWPMWQLVCISLEQELLIIFKFILKQSCLRVLKISQLFHWKTCLGWWVTMRGRLEQLLFL